MTRFFVIAALTAAALTAGIDARAQDEKQIARETFRAAEGAFDRGEYRTAATRFEAANEQSANGGALFNAGIAWERAGEPARAADDFSKALASGDLDEKSFKEATSRRAALAEKLATVSIRVPDGAVVSVAHVERAKGPLRVHLTPGSHLARARFADGRERAKSIRAVAGAQLEIDFGDAESAGAGPLISESSDPAAADARPESTPSERAARSLPWPWIAVGGGAAIVGVGAYLRYRGYQANRDFEDSNRTDANARDRALSLRTWSGVALIGGAAIAATGVVLLVIESKSRSSSSPARVEAVIGNGVALRLRHF